MPYSWIGQAMDAIFQAMDAIFQAMDAIFQAMDAIFKAMDAIQWTLSYPNTCVHSTSLGYEVRITEIRMGRASKFYVI